MAERKESGTLSIHGSTQIQNELTSLAGVLGRKWNLVIIDRLLRNGPLGFSDLLNDIDGISSKVLSESLDDLEESGFVDRNIVNERPVRVEYSLTHRAVAIEPLIEKVREGTLSTA
ncbi:winged helix-turn-helix transcriptional regulator [Natrinema amylolyticum]|uniref:winged helix-turn-helix transcriptional regulator n=1 Tax=Natrinema amylolyticum TaxID=2878679 RepID=UPI001CFB7F29|nr:helix-turn-helix domain-containing protein [Natrinema amylolyticum]